jgi:hypothetical protein
MPIFNRALFVLVSLALAAPALAKEPKLTPEQLVAKHLEALGSAEDRASAATHLAEGSVALKVLIGGAGNLQGRVQLASEAESFRAVLGFDAPDYGGESWAFLGDRAQVGLMYVGGQRSPIGAFLSENDDALREGLLGGVLSTRWPLQAAGVRGAKLKYDGLKKVEGKQLHALVYGPAKRQNTMRITLYFEPESFRHVRTTYSLSQAPPQSFDITQSSQQSDSRFELEESFDGFEEVDGLRLPKLWAVRYSRQGDRVRPSLWRFEVAFDRIQGSARLAPGFWER